MYPCCLIKACWAQLKHFGSPECKPQTGSPRRLSARRSTNTWDARTPDLSRGQVRTLRLDSLHSMYVCIYTYIYMKMSTCAYLTYNTCANIHACSVYLYIYMYMFIHAFVFIHFFYTSLYFIRTSCRAGGFALWVPRLFCTASSVFLRPM